LGFTYADGDFREQPIACCTEEQGKDRAKKNILCRRDYVGDVGDVVSCFTSILVFRALW
jgi:hypothetical protein